MSDLMKVGADWGSAGTFKPFTAGISGTQRVTDGHAKYLDAVAAGRVYVLSTTAAAPTAYVGAGGGTPLLAIHNPINSNKYANLLAVGLAGRAQASAAGQTGLAVWSGVSVIPTGTTTPPTNMLSKVASGSSMRGFINTALTGSTALNLSLPLWTYYWATAAGAIQSPAFFDCSGLELLAPGNQLAVGLTVALTSATYDVSFIYEELNYLTQV
jgi:hypothetical protein